MDRHYLNVEKLRFKTRDRISKEERLILSKQNLNKFEKLTFKWINLSFCCFLKFVFVPMCYSSFWLIKNRINLSEGGWCHYFKIKLSWVILEALQSVSKSSCVSSYNEGWEEKGKRKLLKKRLIIPHFCDVTWLIF